MEMGDEAAHEFAEDGLGEAMAAVVASKWRKRVVMKCWGVLGEYMEEARCEAGGNGKSGGARLCIVWDVGG